jgi:hypothetical protein
MHQHSWQTQVQASSNARASRCEAFANEGPSTTCNTHLINSALRTCRLSGALLPQVFPYHVWLKGPPSPHSPAVDRGLWVCKPFYTGHNDGGVILASWPELQVGLWLGFLAGCALYCAIILMRNPAMHAMAADRSLFCITVETHADAAVRLPRARVQCVTPTCAPCAPFFSLCVYR